ncbi:MAG: hypothetical protein ACXIUZ_00675 [Lysobacteraceae bacterium]
MSDFNEEDFDFDQVPSPAPTPKKPEEVTPTPEASDEDFFGEVEDAGNTHAPEVEHSDNPLGLRPEVVDQAKEAAARSLEVSKVYAGKASVAMKSLWSRTKEASLEASRKAQEKLEEVKAKREQEKQRRAEAEAAKPVEPEPIAPAPEPVAEAPLAIEAPLACEPEPPVEHHPISREEDFQFEEASPVPTPTPALAPRDPVVVTPPQRNIAKPLMAGGARVALVAIAFVLLTRDAPPVEAPAEQEPVAEQAVEHIEPIEHVDVEPAAETEPSPEPLVEVEPVPAPVRASPAPAPSQPPARRESPPAPRVVPAPQPAPPRTDEEAEIEAWFNRLNRDE